MPTKRTNNQHLRILMKHNKLTRSRVAKELHVNISTVDRWLCPPTITNRRGNKVRNPSYRGMPKMALSLLTARLLQDAGARPIETT